jgi:hypothetical protein
MLVIPVADVRSVGTFFAANPAAEREASGTVLARKEGIMREIIRPETLWRDVIPLAVFALIVLVVFLIAMMNSTEDLNDADIAIAWTMRLIGALISVVAVFGLFWRALNGEPLDLQFGFVLALLAGLLLIDVHWSLAIALGAIGVALIVRELWTGNIGRFRPADTGETTAPADRPLP